jgi:hypothetical protein
MRQSTMTVIPEGERFEQAWNGLPRADRLRLRRLVRIGRPLANEWEAAVAVAYARFQRGRIWVRLFWWWFIPGLVLALGLAASIHPIVIGVALALGAQAVYTRRNLHRTEQINEPVLGRT